MFLNTFLKNKDQGKGHNDRQHSVSPYSSVVETQGEVSPEQNELESGAVKTPGLHKGKKPLE